MLYYLSQLGDQSQLHGALNVFQYISFRAASAAITSFLLCLVFGNFVIRKLISLKVGQPIRTKEEVHKLYELHGAKKGTPTMGGVLLMGSVIVSTLLWARPDNHFVWLVVVSVIYLATIGFIDDYIKVKKKTSDGLPGRLKLVAQIILAAGVTTFLLYDPASAAQTRELYIPFYKEPIFSFGLVSAFIFYAAMIVGTSNAVNLTDGLDGLATGCTITTAAAYAIFSWATGNFVVARYLQIPHNVLASELTVACMALAGAGLGFLWFNAHPARVFMGDTGSLSIGGMLAVVAVCCKQELLLAVVGGVFVIEALSVIIQVVSFQLTGKRVFKMSPIHHHFELSGWKENTVIVRFWILSLVFALLGLATLKLR